MWVEMGPLMALWFASSERTRQQTVRGESALHVRLPVFDCLALFVCLALYLRPSAAHCAAFLAFADPDKGGCPAWLQAAQCPFLAATAAARRDASLLEM